MLDKFSETSATARHRQGTQVVEFYKTKSKENVTWNIGTAISHKGASTLDGNQTEVAVAILTIV